MIKHHSISKAVGNCLIQVDLLLACLFLHVLTVWWCHIFCQLGTISIVIGSMVI
ncbi:unnamed protein product, partial [Brassica oleracea var. botrytis]